jgi:hypothetical protein
MHPSCLWAYMVHYENYTQQVYHYKKKMQSSMLKHVVQVFITVLKVDKRIDDLKAPFWTDGQVKYYCQKSKCSHSV